MAVKKKTWRNVGIALAIVIVVLAIAKSAGWLGSSDAIKVSTEKVSVQNIIETVSANGKVQPEVEVKMSADVSGEVVDLFVKEGDQVQKGKLLCRINPEIYLSSLERMKAALNGSRANHESSKSRLIQSQSQFAKAEATYNRNKKLYDDGAISTSDFESIKSAYEVAKSEVDAAKQAVAASNYNIQSSEAELKEANENLNKTTIYAPVDGTISKLSVEKGERVVGTSQMAGTEIMRIANLNEMEVSVDVSENDIVRVHLNDTADIEVDAYLDRKFKGIVTEVANSANITGANTDQVTNFTVKIRILQESYKDLISSGTDNRSPFRPGMSATVEIRTKHVDNVLALPIQAVTTRDTTKRVSEKRVSRPGEATPEKETANKNVKPRECVFIVRNNKAVLTLVKTGIQDNTYIEIKEGLKKDDIVIAAPYNAISKTLKDQSAVKVVKKEDLFEKEKE